MSDNPTEVCDKCGAAMVLVQPFNPAKAKCPQCGNELVFLWDPAPPKDPHGEADGILIIDSFNGHEMLAAIELRRTLGLTPSDALKLVRQQSLQVLWPWIEGLWQLYDLKKRLDSIGVSSRIKRVHNSNDPLLSKAVKYVRR